MLFQPSEPPVPVPAGKGVPLGHISNVEISLSRFKTNDQKLLHQYLYGVSIAIFVLGFPARSSRPEQMRITWAGGGRSCGAAL